MIKSFRSKETARIFERLRSSRLPQDIQQVSYRKLRMLSNAVTLDDLRVPPANRLEKLNGEREGSTASGSTINGGYALNGSMVMPIT